MSLSSDIEIAQQNVMHDIREVAKGTGVEEKYLELYGKHKAKIDYGLLTDTKASDGKLILITAITPTPADAG